jgi:hypothetical protein
MSQAKIAARPEKAEPFSLKRRIIPGGVTKLAQLLLFMAEWGPDSAGRSRSAQAVRGTERVVAWLADELVREASAAPFVLLGACLRIGLSYENNTAEFRNPVLPGFLDYITLRQLRIGESQLDLSLYRHGADVTLNALRRQDDAKVMLVK